VGAQGREATASISKGQGQLTQAKVKLDKPIELAFLTGPTMGTGRSAALRRSHQSWRTIKVVGYPWPTIVDKFKDPNTTPDVSIYWISTYYADPHNWVGEMYSSATAGTFKNAAHYKNPKVDALLDKALALNDQAERAKLYEEVTRIVVDEAAGLWIYNTKWYGPYSNKLKGIVFCPIGSAQECTAITS
jgi:peptide/nickel transport system substrate-binding protein